MFSNIWQYIVVAVLIGLVIALGNYLLQLSKAQRDRRREAAQRFTSVFETDLNHILESGDDPRHVLVNATERHLAAMRDFRDYLPFYKRRGFDKAWISYFYQPETHLPFLEQYTDFGSLTKRRENMILLKKRMSKILEYAKYKP